MAYLAFDLDALNVCSQAGAACGVPPPSIAVEVKSFKAEVTLRATPETAE